MSGNESSDQNGEVQREQPKSDVSIMRGSATFVGEASVDVEESDMCAVQIVVRGSRNLVRITVDVERDDAERVRDELAERLAE